MASIRRTDIMHKSFSKGRPAKTERERNKRRQEAYRWRDARRIYLANSFDKWRKLRSSLGLKDSGLAWHLMEAHEKGQCGICRRNSENKASELKPLTAISQVQEFLPSLVSSVRILCHSHFQFEDCIKIVGLLCLEFDNARKENFSVNETVFAKSYVSDSHSKDVSKSCTEVLTPLSLSSQNDATGSQNMSNTMKNCELSETGSIKVQPEACSDILLETQAAEKQKSVTQVSTFLKCEQSSSPEQTDWMHPYPVVDIDPASQLPLQSSNCKDDVEKLDFATYCTSNNMIAEKVERNQKKEIVENKKITGQEETIQSALDCQVNISYCNRQIKEERQSDQPFLSVDFVHPFTSTNDSLISNANANSHAMPKLTPEERQLKDPITAFSDTPVELPLDMSLIKTESLKTETPSLSLPSSENHDRQPSVFTHPKVKVKDVGDTSQAGTLGLSAGREDTIIKGRCRSKEESSPSIPWQRRDMSRKEEYEFLEMNPFSDLAEFSLRYPHVHQRTYYRWKRRIKEEYIILEQCPDMTFEQFSSVVLQAKENVFNLWKGLIIQGRGFFAPSTDASSKRIETKSVVAKPVNNFSAEYLYLQKNLNVSQDQFCRKFPQISVDIFNVLKRKVMQEFWLFYQNKQMSWKEFSKILSVPEDVHNCWREYVESMRLSSLPSDMKGALGDFSPSAQMFSSSFSPFLESPPSPVDSNSQLSKESIQNSLSDRFSSPAMHLDSTLKNSVSRNLSASYLSSLQNMMLPWASFYNMAPPLGQQMLPMMLWPRMLGLASGLAGPMNISSLVSASAAATTCTASSVSPSLDVLANVSRDAFSPQADKDHGKDSTGNFLHPKSDVRSSKLYVGKRPSSESVQESNSVFESDSFKKQKLKEDWDGGTSPYSRSRKQNKQEYIYYLKNPDLCFKDLETLFPAISVRTFYRWRKEMNAAVLFIEDNKALNYQQFKLVFPDIPEDVFDSWRAKSVKISASKPSLCETDSTSNNLYHMDESFESRNGKDLVRAEDSGKSASDLVDSGPKGEDEMSDTTPSRACNLSSDGDSSHTYNYKICREAHLFVHQNPHIDFSVVIQMFPNVSIHDFYRWKKQWRDATDFLRANPDIDFETYKSMDASVSKELFDTWKMNILSKGKFVESKDNVVSEENRKDFKANGHCNRKNNGPEFVYLQLNPYIDFSQFTQVYPDVPSRTFYRWKREIQQILTYVRNQPTISFSEISAFLPDVSEEAFFKWKELIQQGSGNSDRTEKEECPSDAPTQVDEEAKTKMTKALLHLMHNPNMGYSDFHEIFDFVSTETFQLWLHRIKLVVLHISSNPSLNYDEFSSAITDIGEDVFKRWKNLTPEEISSIGIQSQDCSDISSSLESSENGSDIKEAMFYCQKYPNVTYNVFLCKYPNISKSQFKQWMLKISDQIAFIKDNPGLTYEDFHKVFEDVRETVFEAWKEKPFPQIPILNPDKAGIPEIGSMSWGQDEKSKDQTEDTTVPFSNEVKSFKTERILHSSATLETSSISSEAISSTPGAACNGKENEVVSTESSLSKLTKFAESDVSLYTRWAPESHSEHDTPQLDLATGASSSLCENGPTFETLHKTHLENDIDNNNVRFNSLYSSVPPTSANAAISINKLLNPLSNNISINEIYSSSPELSKSPMKYEHNIDDYSSAGNKHLLPSENKSLSALMVMSTNKAPVPIPSSNFKHAIGNTKSSHSSSSGNWNASQVISKEEDEIFSSQRQKKMSRAEYLFVKDNPDVDSQEFARIFPGVSARTFYRWKKEIKAQIQLP